MRRCSARTGPNVGLVFSRTWGKRPGDNWRSRRRPPTRVGSPPTNPRRVARSPGSGRPAQVGSPGPGRVAPPTRVGSPGQPTRVGSPGQPTRVGSPVAPPTQVGSPGWVMRRCSARTGPNVGLVFSRTWGKRPGDNWRSRRRPPTRVGSPVARVGSPVARVGSPACQPTRVGSPRPPLPTNPGLTDPHEVIG